MKIYYIACVCLLAAIAKAKSVPPSYKVQPWCQVALGMQSGDIQDEQITASSSFDKELVGPQHARLKTEQGGGAWCPEQTINSRAQEWLQIDLQTLHLITGVLTQGRFANGKGKLFTKAYILKYQREEGGPWKQYVAKNSDTVFPANNDTYSVFEKTLEPPIVARQLRIIPVSITPLAVCMRVELKGCQINESCQAALGMESGDILDDQITASSSLDVYSVGPQRARLQNEEAWCPKPKINATSREWLKIDLQTPHQITGVLTQGGVAKGQGTEYAEKYRVEYQHEGGWWISYEYTSNNAVFPGNHNSYEVAENNIDPPIIARRVRIIPLSENPKLVCIKVELKGCQQNVGGQ